MLSNRPFQAQAADQFEERLWHLLPQHQSSVNKNHQKCQYFQLQCNKFFLHFMVSIVTTGYISTAKISQWWTKCYSKIISWLTDINQLNDKYWESKASINCHYAVTNTTVVTTTTTISGISLTSLARPSVLWHCWLAGRKVLPFWYRLTQVVLEKGTLNGCVCITSLAF